MHTAIDYALDHDVHLAIFAGDIYKHRDPRSHMAARPFAGCVRRLAEAEVPVVILVGNHDQPNTLGKAHAVEIFDTLGLPRVTVISKPELHTIKTATGPVQVAGFPYMTRSFMLSQRPVQGFVDRRRPPGNDQTGRGNPAFPGGRNLSPRCPPCSPSTAA